jgi:hypothetical protein
MTELTETLDRRITICARRETVFAYFTDSERFAKWWGEGSHIDPRPGGAVFIHYPNGITAKGEVVLIEPPRRIEFTYIFGGDVSSLVTITERPSRGRFSPSPRLLEREGARPLRCRGGATSSPSFPRPSRRRSRPGPPSAWMHSCAPEAEPDAKTRRAPLESCATPGIVFRDAYSATDGLTTCWRT